ncbi:MAG: polyprenyl diphosphate synthase [Gammaproteobacteria bacterium]|nr:polyprenyl diphosphate synthase [Gammaproteobacteria bacterium]MDE0283264.1 polyprenyl diphosphate synthase [Gammaproteobacteria bacterium]
MNNMPEHVAIVMDGNGRWAKNRGLPRAAGHKAGIDALRGTVEHSIYRGIKTLTVYVFSSENWQRPDDEVALLIELFIAALNDELDELDKNNVRLSFIGDISVFPDALQASVARAGRRTSANSGLNLIIAINYGGRREIMSACKKLFAAWSKESGSVDDISEESFRKRLDLPDYPDLFIRTGGEVRISNFLLWQLAYTEMYFTDVYWPDFNTLEYDKALESYVGRQRRFGRTSEQVREK